MALSEPLEQVADVLGFGGTSGYVDGSVAEIGARDFVWRDLRDKCRVSSAYFRGAVPLVAFLEAHSTVAVTDVHRRLWNFGRVPILIAVTDEEVQALSCVTPPSLPGETEGPLLLSVRREQPLAKVLANFTRFSIESGRVALLHPGRFERRNRVDRRLLENLRRLRGGLIAQGLSPSDVETLLGRSIFIRYLEDRGILSPEHLLELGPHASYGQALAAGQAAVADLFEALSEHFNGDVFAEPASELRLPAEVLDDLRHFFSGTDLASGQQALWAYDFGVIPPELISSIYEQLLEESQRRDAAYYTPRHVVDLVLDEMVPWEGAGVEQSVLDPSCGSGIFLAEAFRRMAYRHTVVNGNASSFGALSALLTKSIYGVDRSRAAVGVSVFGLYLALLEHVDPPTAWRVARLPDLVGDNLLVSDFFEDNVFPNRKFDIVVGNPPWQSDLSPAAERYVTARGLKLPDRQIADAFLRRSAEFVGQRGAVGLVMPAKSLLHNRSTSAQSARIRLFSDLDIETVVDLSPLRKETFGAAVSPAAIAIARHPASEGRGRTETVYLSPRRTPLASAIDGIAVSQANIRRVAHDVATTYPDVWKTYLWGDRADFELVTRLRQTFPSLDAIAHEHGWVSGQGFQVKGGDRNDASALIGLKLLSTESVESLRLSADPVAVVTDAVMHRPRNPALYRAPHVVMRNGFAEYPMATFLDIDAAFTNGLFGLAGPSEDAQDLRVVAGLLNSSLARYWYFMTSSSWGVEREKLELSEYLSLPVPPLPPAARKQIIQSVRLAAKSRADEWRSELDHAVFDAYELTRSERDLVRDGLELRLNEFQRGPLSVAYRPTTQRSLETYVRLLGTQLSSIEGVQWEVGIAGRSSGFTAVTCRSVNTRSPGRPTAFSIERLVHLPDAPLDGWRSPAAVIEPSILVVDGSSVHVVKPDQRRSWTRSAARADAGDVISAILTAPTLTATHK